MPAHSVLDVRLDRLNKAGRSTYRHGKYVRHIVSILEKRANEESATLAGDGRNES